MDKMKTQKSTHTSPRKVCDEKKILKNEIHVGKILWKVKLSNTRRLAGQIRTKFRSEIL